MADWYQKNSEEALQEAVKRHIPRGTEELNMRALSAGEELASAAK